MTQPASPKIEFFSKLANPYFIIPTWICWFVAMAIYWVLLFHSAFIGPTHVFAGSDGPVISKIGLFAMSTSILAMVPQARGFFVNSFIVVLENDHLVGIKMFGVPSYDKLAREPLRAVSSRWIAKVPLNEIIAIRAMPYFGITSVQMFISVNGQEIKVLEISSGLKGVGELLENILPLMESLYSIELKKFTETRYWGKTPDWTVINNAKRCAAQNQEKLRATQSKAEIVKELT